MIAEIYEYLLVPSALINDVIIQRAMLTEAYGVEQHNGPMDSFDYLSDSQSSTGSTSSPNFPYLHRTRGPLIFSEIWQS